MDIPKSKGSMQRINSVLAITNSSLTVKIKEILNEFLSICVSYSINKRTRNLFEFILNNPPKITKPYFNMNKNALDCHYVMHH